MRRGGGVQFRQRHLGSGARGAPGGIDLERTLGDPVQVHHHSLTHIPPGHPAAGAPGHQRGLGAGRPSDEPYQVIDVVGSANTYWKDTIDPRSLGVRGPGARIGPIETADGRRGEAHVPEWASTS